MNRRLIPTRAVLSVAALVSTAAISACSWFETEVPPPCPRVSVLSDAARLTRFAEGAGRDLTDVTYEAEITNVFSSCEHLVDDDTGRTVVVIAVAPVVSAARGPANRDHQARFDYFVTVVGADNTILNKEAFGLAVQFPGNRTRVRFRDDDPPVTVDLPLSGEVSVRDYRLFVGFQLTPDELSYNRRRGATR